MSHESFPQPYSEDQAPLSDAPELGTVAPEQEGYGWNEIIVPEEYLKIAEKRIRELGVESASKEIPENRQYLDNDKNAQSFGEFVLALTYLKDRQPVDRETLKRIMVALRENEPHVIVRVARLASGEHLG